MVVSGEVAVVSSQSWELFVRGGWSEPLGQAQLLDWQFSLSPTAKAATWHVQLGSHCLSQNEILGLLHRVGAETWKKKKKKKERKRLGWEAWYYVV